MWCQENGKIQDGLGFPRLIGIISSYTTILVPVLHGTKGTYTDSQCLLQSMLISWCWSRHNYLRLLEHANEHVPAALASCAFNLPVLQMPAGAL